MQVEEHTNVRQLQPRPITTAELKLELSNEEAVRVAEMEVEADFLGLLPERNVRELHPLVLRRLITARGRYLVAAPVNEQAASSYLADYRAALDEACNTLFAMTIEPEPAKPSRKPKH